MTDETRETLAVVREALERAARHAEMHPDALEGAYSSGTAYCAVGHLLQVCNDTVLPLVAAEIACVLPQWVLQSYLPPRGKIETWNDCLREVEGRIPDGPAKAALFRAAIERMDNPNAA